MAAAKPPTREIGDYRVTDTEPHDPCPCPRGPYPRINRGHVLDRDVTVVWCAKCGYRLDSNVIRTLGGHQ